MSTGKITKGQIACVYAMLKKLQLNSDKDDIVAGCTDGRTTSVSAMTVEEGIALIKWLKKQDPDEKKAEKQRRYIISMAHECGYEIPGTGKVNMQHLDEWCIKYGYLHKKLNQYTQKELPQLVTQFENLYKSYLNKV